MSDEYELNNDLDPFIDDAAGDYDGDGLTNLAEYQIGTAANDADSDDDGVSDFIEFNSRRNPVVDEAIIIQIINSSD